MGDALVRSIVSSVSVHNAAGAETIECGIQGHSQAACQIHEQGGTHLRASKAVNKMNRLCFLESSLFS
jgi:hypothetical protein